MKTWNEPIIKQCPHCDSVIELKGKVTNCKTCWTNYCLPTLSEIIFRRKNNTLICRDIYDLCDLFLVAEITKELTYTLEAAITQEIARYCRKSGVPKAKFTRYICTSGAYKY